MTTDTASVDTREGEDTVAPVSAAAYLDGILDAHNHRTKSIADAAYGVRSHTSADIPAAVVPPTVTEPILAPVLAEPGEQGESDAPLNDGIDDAHNPPKVTPLMAGVPTRSHVAVLLCQPSQTANTNSELLIQGSDD